MVSPKDILVTTTSTISGHEIIRYLNPVSAHIVAGTNLFSDFFASFSDFFGGRSQSYQKQLASLYKESIERLKIAAYELGANCIVGLHIDMDEISGKGKSMFMLTATGTAVLIDNRALQVKAPDLEEKVENVSFEKIKVVRKKRELLEKANTGTLKFEEDDVWNFITTNKVHEIYDFIISKLDTAISYLHDSPDALKNFYESTLSYIDSLPEELKADLLYQSILSAGNEKLAYKLCDFVNELQVLDYKRVAEMLDNNDFKVQKRALRILLADKPFYNKEDISPLNSLIEKIREKFPERGTKSVKKQLLSSKEKEVWTCECGKNNEIGANCSGCQNDIYGFKAFEVSPAYAIYCLQEKITIISEYTQ